MAAPRLGEALMPDRNAALMPDRNAALMPDCNVALLQGHNVTFVPADPARKSWFALWGNQLPGLVNEPELANEQQLSNELVSLEVVALELVLVDHNGQLAHTSVEALRMSMAQAIDILAVMPAEATLSASGEAWSTALMAGLGLVAQGRLLPSISDDDWDEWRAGPLEASDKTYLAELSAAMPAQSHCMPVGSMRISEPEVAIRRCWDAVADVMTRSPAAQYLDDNPAYADVVGAKVPQLATWARDVAAAHEVGANLVLTIEPPAAAAGATLQDGPQDCWLVKFQLRSQEDPSLLVDAAELWRAPAEVLARLGDSAESDLLAGIALAGEICPLLAGMLEGPTPSSMEIAEEDLEQLLQALDALADASIEVRWPSSIMAPRIDRKLVVGASAPGDAMPSVNQLDQLLQVDWEFLLDGVALSSEELVALADAKRAIVPLRGRWVRLDKRARDQLLAKPPDLRVTDVLAVHADPAVAPSGWLGSTSAEQFEIVLAGDVAALADKLAGLDGSREEPEPPGLHAELRPYQRRGLAWLSDLCQLGLGGCLADDMGLGKTIQMLALHRLRGGTMLVVCPTSLMANWEREVARFLPGVIVHRYHGQARSLETVEAPDIVITTYGVVRSDVEALADFDWDLVVADEAQNLKNPRSRTAKAIRAIPGSSRIALTGTPVENRLSELWSIMDWVAPGLLGPLETFRRTVAVPIERNGDKAAALRLQRLIAPFLLRRKKTDPGIAPELPAKLERDVVVPLTPEQVSLYRATTTEALAALADNDGIARQGLVLKLLTGLKQITNHPAQYLGESEPLLGRSGKLDALDDLIDLAVSNSDSTLIFSQYVAMGQLLVSHLSAREIGVGLLHGGLSVSKRQELVDEFQAGKLPVLVLSLKAGGTGLNLTQASHVIHYDRWWNPAVEDQATDRAYRIGQDKTVTVHRLITEGTVEDRVSELLSNKRKLADRVIGSGESWIGNLDDEELAELVLLKDQRN